jgi:DNA gyrase subunit A
VDIIKRRTQYDYDRAVARVHILEGLLVAIKNIDEVIAIIKSSESTAQAKTRLMERFNLTEVQAVAILDMKLARLTNLETTKIEQEMADLKAKIEEYRKILSSKARQLTVVKREILEIKKRYPTPRKTEVVEEHETFVLTPIEKLVNTECLVAVSDDGLRLKNIVINAQLGSNKFDKYESANVLHRDILKTTTNSYIYAFTNLGNMYKIAVGDIPVTKFNGKGTNLAQITKAEVNEKIVNIFEMEEFKEDGELLMFTQDGYIKRSDMSEFVVNKPVVDALGLHDFDRLVAVQPNYNMAGVLMVSRLGMAVNMEYASVPKQKRQGGGVIGMNLNEGDKVVFASQVNLGDKVLVVTENSSAKRVSLTEFPVSARNRKGLKLTNGAEQVEFAVSPVVTGEVVVTDSKGNFNVVDVNEVPVTARTGVGKPIIKQKALQKVKSATIYIA